MKQPAVYILANKKNGTLYIGVTSDLVKRIWQHKNHVVSGFTQEYEVYQLVYFEQLDDMENAITREKVLKQWNRAWKIRLIEQVNPNWNDLYDDIVQLENGCPIRDFGYDGKLMRACNREISVTVRLDEFNHQASQPSFPRCFGGNPSD